MKSLPGIAQAGFFHCFTPRTTMSLKDKITEDMKAAMRAKDSEP
jgi:hypothetical protein